MVTVKNVSDFLAELAPPDLKMDFDNVGLLVGVEGAEVTRVLAALDITDDVIAEAADMGAQLIVSHHPLFFAGLSRVTDGDSTGRRIIDLLVHGVSAICMHTNLDAAQGGVNDSLANALGCTVTGILNEKDGISRTAMLPVQLSMPDFLARTAKALGNNGLRYHDAGRPVKNLGLCGGSGGDDIELAARMGCDTYLTADLKYHQFLLARELSLNLIDADHFCTENVVVPVLAEKLRGRFPELTVAVSRRHGQSAQFYIP